ncbi:MAG: DUF1579 domain-containing protein [Phycisphaerales bacterium]|nr:DUF1579 domain-containing protein [Phycisphaerales bacterium]
MRRVARIGFVGLAAVAASLSFAEPPKDKAAQPGEHQLPPGWTEADMKACMDAGTPGEMQKWLTEGAGVWTGKQKMWMAPDTEAMASEVTMTITPIMEGRFVKCEFKGDIPGMGPYTGVGITGYDNVSRTFQGTWIDNHSTGIMMGKAELSSDNKTLTWSYDYSCPITQKTAKMREIDKITGKDTRTMEMWGLEPKSGKEYKMMEISFTRTGAAPAAKH